MAAKSKATTSKKVETKKLTCSICGKTQAIINYYASDREEYVDTYRKSPYCKKCLKTMVIDLNTNKITVDKFKQALKILNIPFVNSLYVDVYNRNGMTNDKMIGAYISAVNLNPEIKKCTYQDSVLFEIKEEQLKNSIVEQDSKKEVTSDMIMFWGKGLASDDYFDLQARFDRFMSSEEDPYNLDYKKELDYKKLVIWEFQLSKIQYDLDKIKEASQLQKNIADLSNDLGIKAIQKKEDNSNKGAYDLFIKKIETTRPVFDFERDLGNRDEIKELLQLYFYGYLMDVNNQKTEFTEALYKDIEKYTPDVSNVYEREEEDGD